MGGAGESNLSANITRRVAALLEEGSTAALATIVEAQTGVGAKLLVETSGSRTGTTGDEALDAALAVYAQTFLASRASAQTSASTQPPPTVPAVAPPSKKSIFAPRRCGVEPRVCATVATTTRSPRAAASPTSL